MKNWVINFNSNKGKELIAVNCYTRTFVGLFWLITFGAIAAAAVMIYDQPTNGIRYALAMFVLLPLAFAIRGSIFPKRKLREAIKSNRTPASYRDAERAVESVVYYKLLTHEEAVARYLTDKKYNAAISFVHGRDASWEKKKKRRKGY